MHQWSEELIRTTAARLHSCDAYSVNSYVYVSYPELWLSHIENEELTQNAIGVGTSDNYAYLVVDDKSKDAVIIDPANPPE